MTKNKLTRKYPRFYENIFPIAFGFLGIAFILLLVIIISVALRLGGMG